MKNIEWLVQQQAGDPADVFRRDLIQRWSTQVRETLRRANQMGVYCTLPRSPVGLNDVRPLNDAYAVTCDPGYTQVDIWRYDQDGILPVSDLDERIRVLRWLADEVTEEGYR